MVDTFAKLADWVIRHCKKIVVAWIVILILAVPLMMRVGEVVVYEETALAPEDIESGKAQEIINEQFPMTLANSTAMIVIQSSDIRDEDVKNYTMALDENVTNDPDIHYLQGVTTIYTVYKEILESTVDRISPYLYEIENSTNMSAFMFYGIPSMYTETWTQVNGTCFMVYGVPSIYLGEWLGNSSFNDTLAYANTSLILNGLLATGDFNATQQQMIWDYYNTFTGYWNVSTEPNPMLRAQYAIDNATIQFTSAMPPEEGLFIQGIWQSFNLTNWGSPIDQSTYANSTFWSMLGMYGIDPEELAMVGPYYYAFYNAWIPSFSDPFLLTLTPEQRAEYCIILVAPQYIDSLPISDDDKQIMNAILAAFNLTTWSNQTIIHDVAINAFALMSGSMFGISDVDFLEDVYLLGASPSQDNISSFSQSVVDNGTLHSYPVPIPSDIYYNFVSPNNDTMLVIIGFTRETGFGASDEIPKSIDEIRSIVSTLKSDLGMQSLTTYVSGEAAISADMAVEANKDIERIDPVTITLVIILLGLFFLAIVTPFVPLGVVGVAIVVSQGFIFLIGTYIANVHYSVITMLVPLLLAVGVDYSIFIIARYREERRGGKNREEAVRTSVTWAGESIATSGGVVMISFGALSIAGFGLLRTMGLVFMIGVGVALLTALTLLPALILLVGNRIFWPSRRLKRKTWLDSADDNRNPNNPKEKSKGKRKRGYFGNAARASLKYSKAIVAAALLISIPTTLAVLSLETSFDFIAGMPDVESKLGLDAMAEGFGKGNIIKTYVVVQKPYEIYNGTSFDNAILNSIDNLTSNIAALDNIEKVTPSTVFMGGRIDQATWEGFSADEKDYSIRRAVGEDYNTVLITIVFEEEPFSKESMNSISSIRNELDSIKNDPNENLFDATIYVGGETAGLRDIQDSMNNDFRNMAIIVVVGIFILLLIILGSVLVPLRLILTIALSISWALAMTMLLFEWFKGIPVLWLMPMILFIILMGLGMDYDIFLVTRIREEVAKGKTDEEAIVTAVERTGGIITACGIIMAGAFASLMLSTMGLLQEFGFGLSFAIIIDAMLVRIYLVPAIMVLLKKWNWWAPGRLQRVRREEKNRDRKEKVKKKKKKEEKTNKKEKGRSRKEKTSEE